MSHVLGLSAFRRDASAVLVSDGVVRHAVQEERLTRVPNESSFPRRSVRACLDAAGLSAADLDLVIVSEKPLRRFERILVGHVRTFPRGARGFSRTMFAWLGDQLWMRGRIASDLEIDVARVRFVEHGVCHAAAAAAGSGAPVTAALVLDDVGEWATTTLARCADGVVEPLLQIPFPHSLGLVASALTEWCGLTPARDEVGLDRLAAVGEPRHAARLREFVRGADDGSFSIDHDAFPFEESEGPLFGAALVAAIGAPRTRDAALSFDDSDAADVAASVLLVLQERAVACARALRERVPDAEVLAVGGLLARLPRLVAALAEDAGFERIVCPNWTDECGAALGAALIGAGIGAGPSHPFLGPAELPGDGDRVSAHASSVHGVADAAADAAAARVARGEVIGWVRGPLAFGDHGAGGRSAFADPRDAAARPRLLDALRRGDDWQPAWLALTEASAREHVEGYERAQDAAAHGTIALRISAEFASSVPAAVAPDGRARVLVPRPGCPSGLDALLRAAEERRLPGLLVADLALRGAPLVRSGVEATELFERSALDALFVEGECVTRDGRSVRPTRHDADEAGVGVGDPA